MIGTVLLVLSVAMLTAAAILVLVRMARGPSTLDRVVATEVLVNIVIAALAMEAVFNGHATTVPIMLVLALLGFAGSLSMARFVADRDKAKKWDTPRRPGPERVTVLNPAERSAAPSREQPTSPQPPGPDVTSHQPGDEEDKR